MEEKLARLDLMEVELLELQVLLVSGELVERAAQAAKCLAVLGERSVQTPRDVVVVVAVLKRDEEF